MKGPAMSTGIIQITELLATCERALNKSDAVSAASLYAVDGVCYLNNLPGAVAPEANRELLVLVREARDWKIGRYMFNKSEA